MRHILSKQAHPFSVPLKLPPLLKTTLNYITRIWREKYSERFLVQKVYGSLLDQWKQFISKANVGRPTPGVCYPGSVQRGKANNQDYSLIKRLKFKIHADINSVCTGCTIIFAKQVRSVFVRKRRRSSRGNPGKIEWEETGIKDGRGVGMKERSQKCQ